MKELVDFSEEGEEAIFKSIFNKRDLCYLGAEAEVGVRAKSKIFKSFLFGSVFLYNIYIYIYNILIHICQQIPVEC